MQAQNTKRIILPHNNFQFRPYQARVDNFIRHGGQFVYSVWHRKSGKDAGMLHTELKQMLREPGSYFHFFPTTKAAKDALIKGVNPHTRLNCIEEVFPTELIDSFNKTELTLQLKRSVGGANITFGGFENYDSLVGANPKGIVMSEFAVSNKASLAYEKFYPQILNSKGFMALITTPRGKNHAYELWENVKNNPKWLCTEVPASISGVYTDEELRDAKQHYIDSRGEKHGTAIFNQELMVDWMQAVSGSYYYEFIERARQEKRIIDNFNDIPFFREIVENETYETIVSFDLGMSHPTIIWVGKVVNGKVFVIDFYRNHGKGADHYMEWIRTNYPYVTSLVMPHDIRVREWGSGKSRVETVRAHGYKINIAPELSIEDGINAVKETFPLLYFNNKLCYSGIDDLIAYHQDYNETNDVFKYYPANDSSVDTADCFRYFCSYIKADKKNIKSYH